MDKRPDHRDPDIPPLLDHPRVATCMRVVLTFVVVGMAGYVGLTDHGEEPALEYLGGFVIGYWFREHVSTRPPRT